MTEHWASIGHFPLISYCYNSLFPLGFASFLFFLFGLSLFPRTILSLLLFFKLKVFIILFPGFLRVYAAILFFCHLHSSNTLPHR